MVNLEQGVVTGWVADGDGYGDELGVSGGRP